MFVMYFPFIIAAGKLYKAIPPLYSIPDGKNKRRYFVDQLDIIKYNQKVFLQKYTLSLNKTKSLSNKDVSLLFLQNVDYIYYLEKSASTYAVDPYLLQMVLFHYLTNNGIKYDKLKKEITSTYRFMDVYKKKSLVIVEGTIDKYNCIICNERFINDCKEIISIMKSNKSFFYLLNNKKTSLYDIMKIYNSTTPNGMQRYKGLGEMPREQLAESTVLPDNRTLIQYTLDDAKALLHDIREYESDTKKILATIKHIDRNDLVE